ncbi:MAG TPA: hypothetical protein VKU93_09910 [Terracidiphilus sp.]|jgi:hypothetical protein|nr:hypothetical protein [Terracidiphilus sp.]
MSETSKRGTGRTGAQQDSGEQEPAGPGQSGPSLTAMYALIALALAVAIGFALLIVWPFYRHRY